jgi:putative acetyltransferase
MTPDAPELEDDLDDAPESRDYRPADAPALRQLFIDAIRTTAAEHYSEAQCAAWASFAEDEAAFTAYLNDGWIRVLEDEDGILGFAQMNFPGELAMLYTSPEAARCGVASLLMEDMLMLGEAMGTAQLEAKASLLARPLLERFGFVCTGTEIVERAGEKLERFCMQRSMQLAQTKKKPRKA